MAFSLPKVSGASLEGGAKTVGDGEVAIADGVMKGRVELFCSGQLAPKTLPCSWYAGN